MSLSIALWTVIYSWIWISIKAAYQIKVDLGHEIGIKNSSAQITNLYSKDELINKQVIVVVNPHLELERLQP